MLLVSKTKALPTYKYSFLIGIIREQHNRQVQNNPDFSLRMQVSSLESIFECPQTAARSKYLEFSNGFKNSKYLSFR